MKPVKRLSLLLAALVLMLPACSAPAPSGTPSAPPCNETYPCPSLKGGEKTASAPFPSGEGGGEVSSETPCGEAYPCSTLEAEEQSPALEGEERELSVRTLVEGIIAGAPMISPDGGRLAVPTSVGLDLYEVPALARVASVSSGPWTRLAAFSPDGNTLLTAAAGANPGEDILRLWDLSACREAAACTAVPIRLEVPLAGVFAGSLAFSPDGKTFAAGLSDGATRLWSLPGGAAGLVLDGGRPLFSPDGAWIVTLGLTPEKNQVSLFEAATGRLARQWDGEAASFAADGRLAIESQGAARVLDLDADRTLAAFDGTRAAFSPAGDALALFFQGRVSLYSLPDGALLRTLEGEFVDVTLRFSPQGDALGALTTVEMCPGCLNEVGPLVVWQVSDGRVLQRLGRSSTDAFLDFLPNGQILLSGEHGDVQALDARTGKPVAGIDRYGAEVVALAFDPARPQIAVAYDQPQVAVRLWPLDGSAPAAYLAGPGGGTALSPASLAFAPGGDLLAAGGGFWELPSLRFSAAWQERLFARTSFVPSSLAFSPGGDYLAAGSAEGFTGLWETAGGGFAGPLAGYSGWVGSLAFSPDGQALAALYGTPDDAVQLWSVPGGERLGFLSGAYFSQALFAPGGGFLVTLSRLDELAPAGLVQVWSLPDLARRISIGPPDAARAAFFPDGSRLAVVTTTGRLRLYAFPSGELLSDLPDRSGAGTAVACSPDGRTIATGGADGVVKVWSLPPSP